MLEEHRAYLIGSASGCDPMVIMGLRNGGLWAWRGAGGEDPGDAA